MLRRLLLVLLPLLLLLAAALGGPLANAVAERETQATYLDRLTDVGRFASLAESALNSTHTEALQDEVARYGQLYGIPVAVVAVDGDIVAASQQRPDLTDPAVVAAMDSAFAGTRPSPPAAVMPWETAPLVVVEPVGRDSEVVAAVVEVSPTDRLRADILSQWGWLAALGILPLLAVIAAAWPISRWILRPVRRLDEATAAIAGGIVDTHVDDVSGPPELRRLSTSFNTMVDVVNTAMRRQRDFVADASHQLRNPLASLRLAVDNLKPHLPDSEPVREAHHIAVDEAQEMGNVLDALLAATRLDAAAETVELALLVSAHLPKWQVLGVTVETDVPAGQRVPVSYGSVLDELVANAARLSGGTRVRVFFVDGSLHVADNGTGLSEEDRAQALNRFWRSPRHQNVSGTGLGLSICADLISAAGGTLRLAEANPGLDVVITPASRD
ncbi:HAMP domain-containing sensor histidine kinase [Kutzneria buriramensis]|uniref:Signal transduction histidine-protein kinase/phosphatase MprB n=1 Tax=Kutzneria buriramensis TaxID=1045776 RepID=A0A3E0I077_9PSEU|nr:HAMP domain-containing sensor histidine kinase [Kutzneria buriramensis]REH52031.1 signal transduction histidine kinase [Kutzneria buriramensis]